MGHNLQNSYGNRNAVDGLTKNRYFFNRIIYHSKDEAAWDRVLILFKLAKIFVVSPLIFIVLASVWVTRKRGNSSLITGTQISDN